MGPSSQRRHHGVDARSDQGQFHGQRAGISQPDAQRFGAAANCSSSWFFPTAACIRSKGRFSFADREVNVEYRRHSIDRPVSQPGQQAAPRPVCEGPRHDRQFAQARCWCRRDRSPKRRAATWSPWSIRTTRFASRLSKVGDRIGSDWVIEEGLKPGERVVTDGLFKIRPGSAGESEGSKVMSKFFINRPIVAMVISILHGDHRRGDHRAACPSRSSRPSRRRKCRFAQHTSAPMRRPSSSPSPRPSSSR